MRFSIHFTRATEPVQGSITLGDRETFFPSVDTFGVPQYRAQWKDAVRTCIDGRKCAGLFQSVEIGPNGVGCLWLYPLIPSEIAWETIGAKSRLRGFSRNEDSGVYIGERFMPVTTKASNFERRFYEEYEDGSQGDELSLYFLDLSAPERFYGYIDHNIAHVSHWYYSNESMREFLNAG